MKIQAPVKNDTFSEKAGRGRKAINNPFIVGGPLDLTKNNDGRIYPVTLDDKEDYFPQVLRLMRAAAAEMTPKRSVRAEVIEGCQEAKKGETKVFGGKFKFQLVDYVERPRKAKAE